MSVLIIISKLTYRKSNVYYNLCFSSFILLIINPYYLVDLGFLLSFLATLGILLFVNHLEDFFSHQKENKSFLKKFLNYTKEVMIVSLSANLMIIPVIINSSNLLSFNFLFSNLIISPVMFLLEFLGIIFIFLPNIKILNFIIKIFINIINFVATFFSKIKFTSYTICSLNLFQIILYYTFLGFLYLVLSKKWREYLKKIFIRFKKVLLKIVFSLIVVSILVNVFYDFSIRKNAGLKICFLDVSQGDCTFLITKENKKILIDTGGIENYDIGENVLKPYLLKRKIKKLDFLIFSHLDYDHCGGAISLLEYIDIKYIILPIQFEEYDNYKALINKIKEVKSKAKIIFLSKGDILFLDKYTYINVLWPYRGKKIAENEINNNALVFKLNFKDFSMIFTGDIEKEAEEQILEEYKNNKKILESDILKVAHHRF